MTRRRSRALLPVRGLGICAALALADAASSEEKAAKDAAGRGATIACAQVKGEVMGACTSAVTRGSDGALIVTVTFANGFARRLTFVDGRFTRADTTMSGTGRDTDWRLEGGIHYIRVEDQRYEVPHALVRAR